MRTRLTVGALVIASVCLTVLASTPCAVAEEPTQKFMEGLRRRGYPDMAIEYMKQMERSRLAPADFKKSLTYQQGVTLISAARLERDRTLRDQMLDEAQKKLNAFIKANPKHELVLPTIQRLGTIQVERGQAAMAEANRPGLAKAKKEAFTKKAKEHYARAHKIFLRAKKVVKKDLLSVMAKLKGPPRPGKKEKQELTQRRDSLRSLYIQVQLLAATCIRNQAETFEKGTPEYKKAFKEAAEAYKGVSEKYGRFLAGLYAHLWEARCHHLMGDYKTAIAYYGELLEVDPESNVVLRRLRTKTLAFSIECLIDRPEDEGGPKLRENAFAAANKWVKKARPNERDSAELVALQLAIAKLYKADSEHRKAEDALKAKYKEEAIKIAEQILKIKGRANAKNKQNAKVFLASLGKAEDTSKAQKAPTNFEEAYAAGKRAFIAQQDAVNLIKSLTPQLEKATKAKESDKKIKLEAQIAKANTTIAAKRKESIKYFRLALSMVTSKTLIPDVNRARFYLCYLYYLEDRCYEAAVMGEFIAKHHSYSRNAYDSGKIALACYRKLYNLSKKESKAKAGTTPPSAKGVSPQQFEIDNILRVANYLLTQWPDNKKNGDLAMLLVDYSLRLKKPSQAETYLKVFAKKDAKGRASAELKIGQAFWREYLIGLQKLRAIEKSRKDTKDRAKQAGASATETPDSAQEASNAKAARKIAAEKKRLVALRGRAKRLLRNGVKTLHGGKVDKSLALAVLSLVQIYVEADQPEKAIQWIEDSKLGILQLVRNEHPVATKRYTEEAYKISLRAYVGALPKQKTRAAGDRITAKAKQLMDELNALVASRPNGEKELINIYLSLAHSIETQMKDATPEAKRTLAKGFDTFLTQVANTTKKSQQLLWVAETLSGLATGFKESGGLSDPDAKKYYRRSIDTFQMVLKRGEDKELKLTPQTKLKIRVRLARTQRLVGNYKEAIKNFLAILRDHNMMLNVQVEAAQTYEEWGKTDLNQFKYAALGSEEKLKKDPTKGIIWGWQRMGLMLANHDQYRDQFYQARYKQAQIYYLLATHPKTNAKDRAKYLQIAAEGVRVIRALYPQLGKETLTVDGKKVPLKDWEPIYNALQKDIEAAQKKK